MEDFHSMSRRDLQVLCKKHHIPANSTNSLMAERLTAHFFKGSGAPGPLGPSCLKGSGGSGGQGDGYCTRSKRKRVTFLLSEGDPDLEGASDRNDPVGKNSPELASTVPVPRTTRSRAVRLQGDAVTDIPTTCDVRSTRRGARAKALEHHSVDRIIANTVKEDSSNCADDAGLGVGTRSLRHRIVVTAVDGAPRRSRRRRDPGLIEAATAAAAQDAVPVPEAPKNSEVDGRRGPRKRHQDPVLVVTTSNQGNAPAVENVARDEAGKVGPRRRSNRNHPNPEVAMSVRGAPEIAASEISEVGVEVGKEVAAQILRTQRPSRRKSVKFQNEELRDGVHTDAVGNKFQRRTRNNAPEAADEGRPAPTGDSENFRKAPDIAKKPEEVTQDGGPSRASNRYKLVSDILSADGGRSNDDDDDGKATEALLPNKLKRQMRKRGAACARENGKITGYLEVQANHAGVSDYGEPPKRKRAKSVKCDVAEQKVYLPPVERQGNGKSLVENGCFAGTKSQKFDKAAPKVFLSGEKTSDKNEVLENVEESAELPQLGESPQELKDQSSRDASDHTKQEQMGDGLVHNSNGGLCPKEQFLQTDVPLEESKTSGEPDKRGVQHEDDWPKEDGKKSDFQNFVEDRQVSCIGSPNFDTKSDELSDQEEIENLPGLPPSIMKEIVENSHANKKGSVGKHCEVEGQSSGKGSCKETPHGYHYSLEDGGPNDEPQCSELNEHVIYASDVKTFPGVKDVQSSPGMHGPSSVSAAYNQDYNLPLEIAPVGDDETLPLPDTSERGRRADAPTQSAASVHDQGMYSRGRIDIHYSQGGGLDGDSLPSPPMQSGDEKPDEAVEATLSRTRWLQKECKTPSSGGCHVSGHEVDLAESADAPSDVHAFPVVSKMGQELTCAVATKENIKVDLEGNLSDGSSSLSGASGKSAGLFGMMEVGETNEEPSSRLRNSSKCDVAPSEEAAASLSACRSVSMASNSTGGRHLECLDEGDDVHTQSEPRGPEDASKVFAEDGSGLEVEGAVSSNGSCETSLDEHIRVAEAVPDARDDVMMLGNKVADPMADAEEMKGEVASTSGVDSNGHEEIATPSVCDLDRETELRQGKVLVTREADGSLLKSTVKDTASEGLCSVAVPLHVPACEKGIESADEQDTETSAEQLDVAGNGRRAGDTVVENQYISPDHAAEESAEDGTGREDLLVSMSIGKEGRPVLHETGEHWLENQIACNKEFSEDSEYYPSNAEETVYSDSYGTTGKQPCEVGLNEHRETVELIKDELDREEILGTVVLQRMKSTVAEGRTAYQDALDLEKENKTSGELGDTLPLSAVKTPNLQDSAPTKLEGLETTGKLMEGTDPNDQCAVRADGSSFQDGKPLHEESVIPAICSTDGANMGLCAKAHESSLFEIESDVCERAAMEPRLSSDVRDTDRILEFSLSSDVNSAETPESPITQAIRPDSGANKFDFPAKEGAGETISEVRQTENLIGGHGFTDHGENEKEDDKPNSDVSEHSTSSETCLEVLLTEKSTGGYDFTGHVGNEKEVDKPDSDVLVHHLSYEICSAVLETENSAGGHGFMDHGENEKEDDEPNRYLSEHNSGYKTYSEVLETENSVGGHGFVVHFENEKEDVEQNGDASEHKSSYRTYSDVLLTENLAGGQDFIDLGENEKEDDEPNRHVSEEELRSKVESVIEEGDIADDKLEVGIPKEPVSVEHDVDELMGEKSGKKSGHKCQAEVCEAMNLMAENDCNVQIELEQEKNRPNLGLSEENLDDQAEYGSLLEQNEVPEGEDRLILCFEPKTLVDESWGGNFDENLEHGTKNDIEEDVAMTFAEQLDRNENKDSSFNKQSSTSDHDQFAHVEDPAFESETPRIEFTSKSN